MYFTLSPLVLLGVIAASMVAGAYLYHRTVKKLKQLGS